MKIIIGKNPNTAFRIEDANGKDIAPELCIKSLPLDVTADTGHTVVVMECYADAIELLDASAQVTIVERRSRMSPERMAHAVGMLKSYSDRLARDGCNDYPMEDTEANRDLEFLVLQSCEGMEPCPAGKLVLMNWMVADALAAELQQEVDRCKS